MAREAPAVYLLHGDDEFAIASFLQEMQGKLGDPSTARMNITRLDGRRVSTGEIKSAAYSMPFLTSRRLVILDQPLAALKKKEDQTAFRTLLEGLPASTALVIVETSALKETNWLVKWARGAGKSAYIRAFELPKGGAMVAWIIQHARGQGGQFTPQAASALAALAGSDTRLAAQEVDKLLAYANYQRAVEPDDVEELTAAVQPADVFKMVDAIGMRDSRTALQTLQQLLADWETLPLLGMIVRQFRLLLLVSEQLSEGKTQPEIAAALGMHPYPIQKVIAQSRNFDLPTLEAIYHKLLAVDESIKTGKLEDTVALDTLVAALTMKQPAE